MHVKVLMLHAREGLSVWRGRQQKNSKLKKDLKKNHLIFLSPIFKN